jgi:hypothetical protein
MVEALRGAERLSPESVGFGGWLGDHTTVAAESFREEADDIRQPVVVLSLRPGEEAEFVEALRRQIRFSDAGAPPVVEGAVTRRLAAGSSGPRPWSPTGHTPVCGGRGDSAPGHREQQGTPDRAHLRRRASLFSAPLPSSQPPMHLHQSHRRREGRDENGGWRSEN